MRQHYKKWALSSLLQPDTVVIWLKNCWKWRYTRIHTHTHRSWSDCSSDGFFRSSLIRVYTLCPDRSVWKLMIITVWHKIPNFQKPEIITCGLFINDWETFIRHVEVLYYPGSEQQRHWSGCADVQADLYLICTFVVHTWQKQVFSWHGSYDQSVLLSSFADWYQWKRLQVVQVMMYKPLCKHMNLIFL